jgi:hypothetical protein
MRSVFSIGGSPLEDPRQALPGIGGSFPTFKLSQALRSSRDVAKAVPCLKIAYFQFVMKTNGRRQVGNKILLTITARQNLPTAWLKERNH